MAAHQYKISDSEGDCGELKNGLLRKPCGDGSDPEALHQQRNHPHVRQDHPSLVGSQTELLNGNNCKGGKVEVKLIANNPGKFHTGCLPPEGWL